MSFPKLQLLDPVTQQPLWFNAIAGNTNFGFWSSADDVQRWPVAFGISFLRVDRLELADKAVKLILECDFTAALACLLQDTDDFAPLQPQFEDCHRVAQHLLANDKAFSARDMMQALQFSRVADYFAVRGSSPTFFSGLGLLKLGVVPSAPLIEVGCGAGHFLHWLQARGMEVFGTDTVFSKLCLAHRYMGISADHLLCAVAGKGTPLPFQTHQATNIFCHDVFYFIKDKGQAISDFRRLAGGGGSTMIGHAHLSTADHGVVSGYPVSLDTYRQIALGDAHFYDDAALIEPDEIALQSQHQISATAEAVSFIEGDLADANNRWWEQSNELLLAPIEVTWSRTAQQTTMNWPNQGLAQEYRSSAFLVSAQNPFDYLPYHGAASTVPVHAGLAIPAPFLAFGVKPLRWGVIGGGWIAADYFAPSFQYTPHARLVALCDVKVERRNAFSSTADLMMFSDWREMLTTCELDAVYIATPNCSHAEIFEGAAAAGVRVLCEKPIATNQHDLDRIHLCTQRSPTFFQTAYDQRYHPAHRQIARRIADGILGTVTQVRIHYACWVDGSWNKVAATENWRTDINQAGGGAGFDLLPHCLDLLLMLVDDSIATAHLMYQGRVHEYACNNDIDDGALMAVKTTKGILASLHVGYNCAENQPRRRIEIIGTRGRVEALNTMGQDPGGEVNWFVDEKQSQEIFSNAPETGPFVRQLDMLSRQWIRGDAPEFPIERDIALATYLVKCDSDSKQRAKLEPAQR